MLAFLSLLSFKVLLSVHNWKNETIYPFEEIQNDGPYVQYRNDSVFISYIMANNGTKILKKDSLKIQQKRKLSLNVMTDVPGKSFQVALKKELQNEKTEFPKVGKLLVLSDIEGNFAALRKLLQANKVIDEDFKWKFDNGHVVLLGDFFDRGQQVTEVLWFIYYLEEKAKADGGYIHFVLGNHEIMSLSGDLRYVHKKYLENAALLKQDYMSLYDENSELGRWLRTKNTVEKIGDVVFVHGGLSPHVRRMNITLSDINILARPYYSDTMYNYTNPKSDTMMGDLGPFWYRGYWEKNDSLISLQLDSTLSHFATNHIVTGHTLLSDTVSAWYNGKLFNTDVHHANSKSEALLIENDKFYRVTATGQKHLLMESTRRNF